MPTRRLTASLALLLACWTAPARGQGSDQVVLIPDSTVKATGGRVRGTIQSESPTEVRVSLGASSQAIPLDQIAAIVYGGQPATIVQAESRENAGALAEAADLYEKAAGEARSRPLIAQAASFQRARILADLAMADPARRGDAIANLEGFLKSYPEGRHSVPALESLARLQLQAQDFAAVDATVARLAKLPGSTDRAAVLTARIAAARGQHDEAVAALDRIIAAAAEGSARKREAQLAKAESLAAGRKFGEAEALLRDVIRALPPEDAAAQSAAHNTLGDCLRAAGKPKDALYAYLHTDILYARDKEQHPRALAQIVQLWRVLKRDDRADEALERLRQDYPKSPYLSAATGAP